MRGRKMCLEDFLRAADTILDEVIFVLGRVVLVFMIVGLVAGVFRLLLGV